MNALARPGHPAVGPLFWFTAAMMLTNGAGLPVITGLVGVRSIVLLLPALVGCFFLASLAFRVPLRAALGAPGLLFLAALASHLVIGMAVAVGAARYPFEDALKDAYALVAVLAAAIGGSLVLRRNGIQALSTACLVILGTACLLTLLSPVLVRFSSFVPRDAYFRSSGVFTNPNEAGYVGCLAVVLALVQRAPHGWHRLLTGAALVLGVAAVILSGSRTALATLVLLALFFMLFSRRSAVGSFVSRLVGAALMGIVAFITLVPEHVPFLPAAQKDRLSSIVKRQPTPHDHTHRSVLWLTGLQRIGEAPVLGNGLGEFRRFAGTRCGGRGLVLCGVHNIYLMFLGEAGIVPLALLLLHLGRILGCPRRWGRSIADDVAVGWTLTFAVYAMVSHHLLNTTWCGFVIGLSCAMVAYADETADRSRPRPAGRSPPP